jgi:condensation domain-containing protein
VTAGPLTWGQQHYWLLARVRPDRDSSKIATSWALPAGSSRDAVAAAVHALTRRHESLRTTFPLDDTGRPVAVVRPHRPGTLPEFEATDPAGIRAVTAELARPRMDPAVDPPFRAALITSAGRPVRLAVVVNHVAADGAAIEILWSDFRRFLAEPGTVVPAPPSPREQTLEELSPGDEAVRHWERCLRAGPRSSFPRFRALAVDGGRSDTYHKAVLAPDGLQQAVLRLARRHRVVPSIVYLTAFGLLAAQATGNRSWLAYVSFANRSPEFEGTVGCFFQRCPVHADLPGDLRARDAVRRVRDAYLTGWEHSRYPYWAARERQSAVSGQRGADIRIGLGFNYYETEVATSAWYLDPALAASARLARRAPGKYDDESDLRFDVLVDRGRAEISLLTHRSVLDEQAADGALTGVAGLLLDWAGDETADAETVHSLAERHGLPVRRYDAGWGYVDHSWVDLPALASVLRQARGVADADVFALPGDDGRTRLVGCVAGAAPDPAALRDHVLAATRRRGDLMSPHRWLLAAEAPRGRRPQDWFQLASAPPAPRPGPAGPDEAGSALRTAVGRYQPAGTDPALSYVDGGGSAELTVAVLAELDRLGWTGLTAEDLLSPLSLTALATGLRPTVPATPAPAGSRP